MHNVQILIILLTGNNYFINVMLVFLHLFTEILVYNDFISR